jgi:GNAT superfamily N-acetyltransferase
VYYLAEAGGRVVGQLLITKEWSDWRDGWFWWIQSVFVAPEARRAGAYRVLHEHVVAEARRAGDVRGIRLYTEQANTQAHRVYERMGMRRSAYVMYEVEWRGSS